MKKIFDRSYWIILLLLLIIFITSFLLYKNINAGASGNDNEVIGVLTFKHKTIERKFDSDVIWEKIDSGLIIRNKDTIRSGEFSDAVLTLKDKTKININENSMIYLDISEGDINLNFAYGSMSLAKKEDGTSNTTLKIKSGNNTVEVKNSELTLEKKGKEELSFQVNQGSAKLKNGKEEKELKENESAKLNKDEIAVSEVNINLLSPPDGSIFSGKEETVPVEFSWSVKNANQLKLEIAYDSRFQNIYATYKAANNSYTASLPQGNFYWRIVSEKNKGKKKIDREFSSFRKLTVYNVSPPVILSPNKNQVFTYSNLPPIIAFSWKKLETVRNYKLEISNSNSFTEIIKTFTISQTSLGVDKLETGKYFARIITEPIREEFKPETSKTVSFSIEKNTTLEALQLVSPKKGQEFSNLVINKSGVFFQSKDASEISKYNFQVSSNPDFTKIVLDETHDVNQLTLKKNLDIGEYYWRVIGITPSGQKTPTSEVRNFSVKENQNLELVSPANNSSLDLKNNPISFRCKKPNYKSKFLFEVSKDSEFKEIIHTTKTDEVSSSFSLPDEGKYFWRVSSLAEDETIIAKSSMYSFQIESFEELTAIFPTRNERVDMTPIDSIKFKWEKNSKITQYLFELYRDLGGKKTLLVKAKTKNSSYLLKDLSKLDEGNFTWTLQDSSLSDDDSPKKKKISIPFKIYLSAKPGKPEIKTQKKMYVE